MARVRKELAKELIQFAKKLEIHANYWDTSAKPAFEFARQMSSPKLKKANPNFEFTFYPVESDEPASLKAEFVDGTQWDTKLDAIKVNELRAKFYEFAAQAEDGLEAGPPGKR